MVLSYSSKKITKKHKNIFVVNKLLKEFLNLKIKKYRNHVSNMYIKYIQRKTTIVFV